jgi:xanthine dehydrogenase YagS FAD-binding subunit
LADRGHLVESGDNQFHAILGNSGPAKYVHASRIAPALLALGATLRIAGPAESDENFVLADNFFRTARRDEDRETVLGPDQLLTHILLPPAHGLSSATYEVRQSEGPDMPLAAAAASLRIAGGIVREAKIVLGQVAPVPWVSADAARSIVGRPVTEESARAAGAAAVAAATPLSHNAYKVQLTQTAVTRAILLAAGAEPTWL